MSLLRILLVPICMLCTAAGFAQPEPSQKDQPHYTHEQMEAMLRDQQQVFDRQHIGTALPPFSATTWDGRRMDNASMKGSVYLLTIFYPDCRCYQPGALKKLAAIEAARKDFHILSVLQDTTYLYAYRQHHPEPLRYAVPHSRAEFVALRMELAPPVYVLVDRKGIVVKVMNGEALYALNKWEEEQEELAKRVRELLLY